MGIVSSVAERYIDGVQGRTDQGKEHNDKQALILSQSPVSLDLVEQSKRSDGETKEEQCYHPPTSDDKSCVRRRNSSLPSTVDNHHQHKLTQNSIEHPTHYSLPEQSTKPLQQNPLSCHMDFLQGNKKRNEMSSRDLKAMLKLYQFPRTPTEVNIEST